ncbi:MAG: HAD family hydrolase [Phycisphaerales bacterium]
MPRRYDAVLCDIDGCIGPEDSVPLDADALARLAAHNRRAADQRDVPMVTVCTGRPAPFAEAISRTIANTTLPFICENGVWLYDPAANAWHRDPAIRPEHLQMVRDAVAWAEDTLVPLGVTIQPGKSASMSLFHPDTDFLRSLMPGLVTAFDDRLWPLRVSMTVRWINCDLTHVSKGTGVERWLARTGLPPDRVAAIGDTMSDLAMAERVGFFACPANADPDLRARAHLVATAPEARGVLEILDTISRGR